MDELQTTPMNIHIKDIEQPSGLAEDPSPSIKRVLGRLPSDIRASLSEAQIAALDTALDANHPTRHAINLRVTFFGLAYLVILGAREQRSPERRAEERLRHPLRSPGNIAFLCVIAALGLTLGYALRLLMPGG